VQLRCLIVDDTASFLDAAGTLLERQGLAIVGVASNGDDALRIAQEQRPDVVLLDIELGEESGFDVARQLASANGGTDLTVIAAIGGGGEPSRRRCRRQGARSGR
jgi:CheY-like chemotaxis protein